MPLPLAALALLGAGAFAGTQIDDAVEQAFNPPQGGINSGSIIPSFSTFSMLKLALLAGVAYGGYQILVKK